MQAKYPLSPRSYKRSRPPVLVWAAKMKRRYQLNGYMLSAADAADTILQLPHLATVFFADLRAEVGGLLPRLLERGVHVTAAGSQVKSLRLHLPHKIVCLGDAGLYYSQPTQQKMNDLARVFFETSRVRLAPTPGATSIRWLRKFIPQPIWQPAELYRDLGRGAFRGGALHWDVGQYRSVAQLDIRAAYAWSMSELCWPMNLRFRETFSDGADGFILTAHIDYHSQYEFSPVMIRGEDGFMYHPTQLDNVSICLNSIDLNILSRFGDLRIRNITTCLEWQNGEHVLAQAMQGLANLEARFPLIAEPVKIIRNATYGKIVEADEQQIMSLQPYEFGIGHRLVVVDVLESDDQLFALVAEKREAYAPQHHPLAGSIITALVRSRLYPLIDEQTVYADTDGVFTTRPPVEFKEGGGWGDWRCMASGPLIVVGPRAYAFGDDVKLSGQHLSVTPEVMRAALRTPVQVAEMTSPNPLLMEKIKVGKRTIRAIKYPSVSARDDQLYVTRSPTRVIPIERPPVL